MQARADDEVVTSLLRGLDVIRVLSRSAQPMTLAEVARLADTSRATARRLLLTLEREGYVVVEGPVFRLRPKVMELGDAYLAGAGLPTTARPFLVDLSARVRDTCSMTVLDGSDVVYVDRVRADRLMAVSIAVGTRLPAFMMSSGRVLLAGLTEVEFDHYLGAIDTTLLTGPLIRSVADVAAAVDAARRDGYAITDQELDPSLRSVAAPVVGHEGRPVAAINVSTHVNRTSLDQLRTEVLPELLSATRAVARSLAHQQNSS